MLNTSSWQVQESKLFLEYSKVEGLHWHQTPSLAHRAQGRAIKHPSVLKFPWENCTTVAWRVGILMAELVSQRRGRRQGWLCCPALCFPAPLIPSSLSPERHPDNRAPAQTPPRKNIEKFKHTHLSRVLSGKVTWRFFTASVVYWSKL